MPGSRRPRRCWPRGRQARAEARSRGRRPQRRAWGRPLPELDSSGAPAPRPPGGGPRPVRRTRLIQASLAARRLRPTRQPCSPMADRQTWAVLRPPSLWAPPTCSL
jgi:hypothetical protein